MQWRSTHSLNAKIKTILSSETKNYDIFPISIIFLPTLLIVSEYFKSWYFSRIMWIINTNTQPYLKQVVFIFEWTLFRQLHENSKSLLSTGGEEIANNYMNRNVLKPKCKIRFFFSYLNILFRRRLNNEIFKGHAAIVYTQQWLS